MQDDGHPPAEHDGADGSRDDEPRAEDSLAADDQSPEEVVTDDQSPEEVVTDDQLPEVVTDDETDPQPVRPALEPDPSHPDAPEETVTPSVSSRAADLEAVGDAAAIVHEEPATDEPEKPPAPPDWANELSVRRLGVELAKVEDEVRQLLEGRDPKRRRKLAGTRRWLELEDNVLQWRGSGRIDDASLTRLEALIHKRHYLFKRLKFLACTRPTWNS